MPLLYTVVEERTISVHVVAESGEDALRLYRELSCCDLVGLHETNYVCAALSAELLTGWWEEPASFPFNSNLEASTTEWLAKNKAFAEREAEAERCQIPLLG